MKLIDNSAKTNWKFITIAVVFAILVSGGTIRFTQSSKPTPSQTISIPKTPTPQEQIDASTWQTYRNDEFGYEVEYPGDWEITDVFTPPSPKGVGFTKITKRDGEYYNHASVRIIIEPGGTRPGRTSLEEWYIDSIKALGLGIDTSAYRFKETTFLGYDGVIVNDRKLIVAKDTNVFRIEWSVDGNYDDEFVKYAEQAYNQILSTFRFIE